MKMMTKIEPASPCPHAFYHWKMQKTFFWAPFLLVGFWLILFGLFWIFSGNRTFSMQHLFISPLVLSAPIALLFWPLALAAYFTKQTANPSLIQRFMRYFAIVDDRDINQTEQTAFRWWLSHPGQDWPENAEEIFSQIDTNKFDWHDPTKWSI